MKNKILCGIESGLLEERPYTEVEFKAVLQSNYIKNVICKLGPISGTSCPDVNDTDAWIKFLDLTYRTPAECRRKTAKMRRERKREQSLIQNSHRCTMKHCSSEKKKEVAVYKQHTKKKRDLCGKPAIDKRYFKCIKKINFKPYVTAWENRSACQAKHCAAEMETFRKYITGP